MIVDGQVGIYKKTVKNLFELAGYKLSENYEVDRAYLYLIQNNENGDIEEGNEYLESIGVEKQHYLGVKSRE